jgi:hypothetical protein
MIRADRRALCDGHRGSAVRGRTRAWRIAWNRPPSRGQLAVLFVVAGVLTVTLLPIMFVCIAHALPGYTQP